MKSAKGLCRIFAHAPKITTAAPTQTMMLVSFSVDLDVPAIKDDFKGLEGLRSGIGMPGKVRTLYFSMSLLKIVK
jgi:hypothetical protein